MDKYEIKDVVCDYGLYEDGELKLILKSAKNAHTIKRILEIDDSVPNVAIPADFVEVVRCKDCKYYKTSPLLYPKTKRKFCYKVLKSNGIAVGHGFNETDFCSYGERKET